MRLTINLDEKLYRMAKALAIAEDVSISKAVNILLRRRTEMEKSDLSPLMAESTAHYRMDPMTGLPVVKGKRVLTDEEVDRVEREEDLRHGYAGEFSK